MGINFSPKGVQVGGNPALKDLAVPAGLFFLQQTFDKKTPVKEENGEMIPVSLYDRLLDLTRGKPTKRKTKKVGFAKESRKTRKR